MEIGPYRVQDDGNLAMNNGSWDEFANVLFVDNPVGTGFSYVNGDSYVRELDDMADQFVTFLEKWFKIFPEYADDDVSTSSFGTSPHSTDHCRSFTWPANHTQASTFPTSRVLFSIEMPNSPREVNGT